MCILVTLSLIHIYKAVNYVLNRRDTAETYLEDGRCSFTNNLSENAIRPFAVGRKNWLFSNSIDGANASAVVYTMVEMAKVHELNTVSYTHLDVYKRQVFKSPIVFHGIGKSTGFSKSGQTISLSKRKP